jgi:ribosome-binding ATPase YchF (GTP1/OBG family)
VPADGQAGPLRRQRRRGRPARRQRPRRQGARARGEEGAQVVVFCGAIEAEIAELPEAERREFLDSLGLSESGLDRLIHAGYRLLGLITYFTAGEKEVRAWTIRQGTKAPGAAGVIHTDFERGFIRAEVIHFDDFIRLKASKAPRPPASSTSKARSTSSSDGDVMHFRFNV